MIELSFDEKPPRTSGLTSQISFRNPDFLAGLKTMFNVKDNERIVSMKIAGETIQVFIEHGQD